MAQSDSDLDELLNVILSRAETLLTKHGEFYPIGAMMLSDGEIRHVAAGVEGDEHPASQTLIDIFTENFQKEAREGKLRAAGIGYDALTVPPGKAEKQDAICCSLEHCMGEAVNVFRPYTKTEDCGLKFEDIFIADRTPQFFCQLPSS